MAIVLEYSNFVHLKSVDFIGNINDYSNGIIAISNSHFVTLDDCYFQIHSEHSSAVWCQSGSSDIVMNQVSMIYTNANSSNINSIGSDGSCASIVFNPGYQCAIDCFSCKSEICALTQDAYGSTTSCTCFCSDNDPNCLTQQQEIQNASQESTTDLERIVALVLLAVILLFGFFAVFIWFSVLSDPDKNVTEVKLESIQVPDVEQKLPLHFMIKL